MKIETITVVRNYEKSVFDSVTQFIQMRRTYWQEESIIPSMSHQSKLFEDYLEIIFHAEKSLEQLYQFPTKKLEGAHLIFGSIREMREALASSVIRHQIRHDLINFRITIAADARDVTVQAETNNDNIWSTFRAYKISHNFYGVGYTRDPIATPN